ncbi:MAG: DUF4147 domain-containing protein, partial [Bacillota bacterium]|nr:DUF4147 domain-containing protein [Bacillota bacterium]
MSYIKNRETLLSHGDTALRQAALDILDAGIRRADPYLAAKDMIRLDGDLLTVGSDVFDLRERGRIFVLGAGKATYPIARALEEILGERIDAGVVICKYGQTGELRHCRLHFANHPIPDENGYEAAKEIMELARSTREGDIVLACITGGSTSLMPYPPEGVTIEEKQQVYKALLRSGANVVEMNWVRKHLTRSKGGWLAKTIHPQATLINLTVSDVIGDPLDCITCPTVPDSSTFDDARGVLDKYGLWDKLPESVTTYLRTGGPENETPKDLSDHHIISHIIVPGDAACLGALEKAKELGFSSVILSTMLEGESREMAAAFVAIGKEILINGRPMKAPCAVIGGGEATMKIDIPEPGEGGPSQQFAAAAATWIGDLEGIVVAGIDTDGVDGASSMAGGMADASTARRAAEMGIDLFAHMAAFSDGAAMQALGDAIYTGATGTNVN